MKPITKYKGAILLSAIGDALGWITEFEKSSEELEKKYGIKEVNKFIYWEKKVGGRFNGYLDKIKAGSYSDDTQLMISVFRCIKPSGRVNNELFSKVELLYWLYYARGGGRTVKNAARKVQRVRSNWQTNFFSYKVGDKVFNYSAAGANGAAMRVLPIILANFQNSNQCKNEIFKNSIITHGHPRAIIGGLIYQLSIETALQFKPDSFDRNQFVILIGKSIRDFLDIHSFTDDTEICNWILLWDKQSVQSFESLYQETVSEVYVEMQRIWKMLQNDISVNDALESMGCTNSASRSSGTLTMLAAIFLVSKFPHKPLKALITAVNAFGTDTDSIAAFVGGIIGVIHGDSIVPSNWKDVQDYDYLNVVAENLFSIAFDQPLPSDAFCNDGISSVKLINKLNSGLVEIGESVFVTNIGVGEVIAIDKQKTLSRDKVNFIVDVDFESGQSCRFSKLLSETHD